MAFRLNDPAFLRDPGPSLAALRAVGPVVRTRLPLAGSIWLTTSDKAARTLLKNPETFVRDPSRAGARSHAARFWWMPRRLRPLLGGIIQSDGADHARLRAAVAGAFAKHPIEALATDLRHDAMRRAAKLEPETELISAFIRPFPFTAICRLLGLPEALWPALTHGIAPLSSAAGTATIVRALFRIAPALRLIEEEVARQRRDPESGLIGHIAAQGDLLPEETTTMAMTLFLAGHDTTVHLIACAIERLLTDPEAATAWDSDPALRPYWLEEIMRHQSPILLTKTMTVARDTDFDGAQLKRGAQIAACLIAANRDPARHEDPERFRPDRRPNAHLGFGHGPHVCLGMQLARLEALTAVEAFRDTFPDARLTRPTQYLRRPGIRAPGALHVALTG
ncbi:MAG: cytochrome P450 [Shimia sp.]